MTSKPTADVLFDPDSPLEQPLTALRALIADLETELEDLQLTRFSQQDAIKLGLMFVDVASQRQLPIAIDLRCHDHVLFHASLPGSTPDNDIWIERKSATTERYSEPSLLVGLRGRIGGGRLEDNGWFDQARYASHGGAVPILVTGAGHVATATVSGLPQKTDHDFVVEMLTNFRNSTHPPHE